ncbi:MAG: hypothetical protein EBX69_11515 [Betaproteobacteria bacterium]|nr:hypothetical protein [Betaproteobacteria bacterium]
MNCQTERQITLQVDRAIDSCYNAGIVNNKEQTMMTRAEWLKWIEKTWQECQESAWKEQV